MSCGAIPFSPHRITYSTRPYFVIEYLYFQLDMVDCQSVPSLETPLFRWPITQLAAAFFDYGPHSVPSMPQD